MSLIGIDLGSSQCKAVLFSDSGEVLASSVREYAPVSPGPAMLEINPDEFWQAVVFVVSEVAGVAGDSVRALGISSHGETIIPIGSNGKHVGPALLNADNRAIDEAAMLEKELGREHIYHITGAVAHPMYAVPEICWLRKHSPEVFAASDKFVSAADYIAIRMGLAPVTDYSLASRMMAFDVRLRNWSDEILSAAGIPAGMFPEPAPAGTPAGKLNRTIAAELGLREGTVITIAGHDQPCGSVGAGVVSSDMVSDSAGTYECLAALSNEPHLDDIALSYSLNSYCHVIPNKYVTLAFFPSGIMVRWFRDKLARIEADFAIKSNKDPYEYFEANCPDEPSGLTVTPHLIGSCNPYWNPLARGTIAGLSPEAGLFHIYKGILEGIASEFSINASILASVCGGFSSVRITGGGAKSELGLKLRASLSGLKLETLQNSESVCVGAAMLAGVASKEFSGLNEAVDCFVKPAQSIHPKSSFAGLYTDHSDTYRKVYTSLVS